MRVAINGMGRIGRLLFRRLLHHPQVELVAVNDIMDTENLVYLLQYDSVYGTFPHTLSLEQGSIVAGGRSVAAFRQEHPAGLPWKQLGIDVVLECSGRFTARHGATEHLKAGARKVLLSTTGGTDIPLLIYGFNHDRLAPGTDIISPGGCMTNCSAGLLSVLQPVGIESVQMNFLHSYTSRQELVDGSHTPFRRGRAAAESIIPVEIDLVSSLERLFPALQNRMAAVSTRVPVANGALADCTVCLQKEMNATEINRLYREAAEGPRRGIIEYSEAPLVSVDIRGNTHSCIIDGALTSVTGRHLKLLAWFDNEYGFTSRMIDWVMQLSIQGS